MGLTSGCDSGADRAFEQKHDCVINANIKDATVALTTSDGALFYFSKVYGDCTAACLYTGNVTIQQLVRYLPLLREYLSLNARINCFGSRLINGETETNEFIKQLVENHVLVSHVTNGNRNNRLNEYMVSYNICTASPQISGYASGKNVNVLNNDHNHFDVEKFKEHRKKFGLYLKQGKSL